MQLKNLIHIFLSFCCALLLQFIVFNPLNSILILILCLHSLWIEQRSKEEKHCSQYSMYIIRAF